MRATRPSAAVRAAWIGHHVEPESATAHPAWPPGQAEIAAAGGAGRRHAENADRPLINRAKRTTRPVRSIPPRGASQPRFLRPTGPTRGLSWTDALNYRGRGTPPQRVGAKPPRPRAARAGPAGLRSLPAKQHAPKARPLPATDRGRQGGVPGIALCRRHEPSGEPGGQYAGGETSHHHACQHQLAQQRADAYS
jgi:hypothetical protein